jgi:hypothetical protein
VHPAIAAVGLALVGHAGQSAAVPHQERQLALAALHQEVLHVHLLDLVCAVRIDLRRHAAGREHHLLDRLAFDLDQPAADVERTHVRNAISSFRLSERAAASTRRSREQSAWRYSRDVLLFPGSVPQGRPLRYPWAAVGRTGASAGIADKSPAPLMVDRDDVDRLRNVRTEPRL